MTIGAYPYNDSILIGVTGCSGSARTPRNLGVRDLLAPNPWVKD